MKAKILDGKACAEVVRKRVKEEVDSLAGEGVNPKLATVLVGDDPASQLYVKKKHESCHEVGIKSESYRLPTETTEEQLLALIERLNHDESVHGILVQLPLPEGLAGYKAIEAISPMKDVDGLNPYNVGQISYKRGVLLPCTPKGVITLLQYNKIEIAGRHVVIIGRSNLVGKPLYLLLSGADPFQALVLNMDMLLLNMDATLTICHSKTRNLESHARDADILIAAVGNRPPFVVTADMVKEDAVVVDVGVNRVEGKLCGDVDFDDVAEKASYITPVPGGVGPMTVATLLENTLIATAIQTGRTVKPLV